MNLPPILLCYIIQPSKMFLSLTIRMDLSSRLKWSLTLLDLDILTCFTLAILNPLPKFTCCFISLIRDLGAAPYLVVNLLCLCSMNILCENQPVLWSDQSAFWWCVVVYESEATWSATCCIQLATMWLMTTVTKIGWKSQRSYCSWPPFYTQNSCWFFPLFHINRKCSAAFLKIMVSMCWLKRPLDLSQNLKGFLCPARQPPLPCCHLDSHQWHSGPS